MKLIKQHNTRQTKENKIKQKEKSNKKVNKMKLEATRPPPFSFCTEFQSIVRSIGCNFFNNLSLSELVHSFQSL